MVRILNSTNLAYEWKDINLEGIVEYGGDNFRAIEFQLSFSGNEEKEVWIYYSRDYRIYKSYCNYEYLVGTARAWNHPIESAKFQFNIPKSICKHIPYHSDRNMTFEENEEYYVGKIEYLDWIPETDIIGINWEGNRSLIVQERNEFVLIIIILSVAGIAVLSIYYKWRK